MDGEYDFSFLSGRQRYNNRNISIKGYVQMRKNAKQFQLKRELTAWLLNKGWLKLIIDYEDDYYYIAKCTNVACDPDIEKGRLNVDLSFEAKPFAISNMDGSEVL
ncbi:hypothetical protein QSV55_07180 [Macrococcus bovicus]|nr:phage tail domain-containing protein [Macrococcus bovicus]WJP97060.1 hypothetical protein QSV55_07180 [Macrococcus bovicus]